MPGVGPQNSDTVSLLFFREVVRISYFTGENIPLPQNWEIHFLGYKWQSSGNLAYLCGLLCND